MYEMRRQEAQRLRAWREELPRHLWTPVGTVGFSYFTTLEHPGAAEADRLPRVPCPAGTAWGRMWEYGWFTADVILPESCRGRRVILLANVGGEQLVYADGAAIGTVDKGHSYVTLTRDGVPGTAYHIQIESYAGHGPRLETLGPCPPERPAIPYPDGPQCAVGETVLAVWNEDAYQLMMDVETLFKLLEILPDRSLRAQRVAKALIGFTHIADFELPVPERQESFRAARAALREALACVNGSTAPTMWVFGQSHIDLGWLWPLEETYHKSVRTYATQLSLMEEYPEYRFLLCEPILLEMLRERAPEVWERVRQAVRRGQIEPEGAFYVECDTNIPGGESLVRQLLYGRQWFRETFGVTPEVAWQPDTFGFSAALPQILKQMGIPCFATEKLLRADPETQRFPYQNFIWEGLDGSTVEALSFFKANAPVDPALFHKRWETERSQKENIDTMLYSFGYGDGGGGPDRNMLESLRRLRDLEGAPRARWGSLRDFFRETARQAEGNRWVGELYLAWHRGTYSVQRRQKAAMRRAENEIREAEALAALLSPEDRQPYLPVLRQAWQDLMRNQFHDIAGGVGIRRVHQEAEAQLERIRATLRPMLESLRRKLYGISGTEGYTLINSLPWPRRCWVALPDGREIYAELPPAGAVSAADAELPAPGDVTAEETAYGFRLENRYFFVDIDRQGRITALTDRENGLPLLSAGQRMNDWQLYRNVQTVYDAWELDRDWRLGRMEGAVQSSACLTRTTPQAAEITVSHAFGRSTARQVIRLRASEKRIDFLTEVDWQERRKMLKAHFGSNLLCEDAIHEIQFGQLRRPCHRSHAFAQDRYEVSNQRFSALQEENRGFALLNDGLYGLSSDRGELALTLLRSPLVPDDTCDRGVHRFTYALMPFDGSLSASGVKREAFALNAPAAVLTGTCRKQAGIWCESGSILLETVKPAEDGNGLILRLYESAGATAAGTLRLPFEAALSFCGMTEEEQIPAGTGNVLCLALKPFEIVTLRAVPNL